MESCEHGFQFGTCIECDHEEREAEAMMAEQYADYERATA